VPGWAAQHPDGSVVVDNESASGPDAPAEGRHGEPGHDPAPERDTMRRLFAVAASVAILLALLAPAAMAADPEASNRSVIVSVNGSLDVPADQDLDTVVVIDGTARIGGDMDTLVVAGGTATVTGATLKTVVVVNGTVDLGAGTTVLGDIRTLQGTVTQASGAVVQGSVTALDADLAGLAVVMIPVFIVLFLGLGIAGIVAALLVAVFGARQVREVEALISGRPGQVLVAGIAGSVLLPLLAILLVMTVIGAPIGFGLLFVVLPALAFLAWLVAAIWIGDWLVAGTRGSREPGRPSLAAVVGFIVLALVGMVPFVTVIATLFGFGALLLTAWRILRPEPTPVGQAGAAQPAPSAS
jgi:hypothetical protein